MAKVDGRPGGDFGKVTTVALRFCAAPRHVRSIAPAQFSASKIVYLATIILITLIGDIDPQISAFQDLALEYVMSRYEAMRHEPAHS